ncbi:DUF2179 domain-containing protein [Paenibacillus larvae]|nr:DUF2179 domain-containing protein [Paenibacillus larvae]
MVVINQSDVPKLKSAVKAIDPNAFIILTEASEVLGEDLNNTLNPFIKSVRIYQYFVLRPDGNPVLKLIYWPLFNKVLNQIG